MDDYKENQNTPSNDSHGLDQNVFIPEQWHILFEKITKIWLDLTVNFFYNEANETLNEEEIQEKKKHLSQKLLKKLVWVNESFPSEADTRIIDSLFFISSLFIFCSS